MDEEGGRKVRRKRKGRVGDSIYKNMGSNINFVRIKYKTPKKIVLENRAFTLTHTFSLSSIVSLSLLIDGFHSPKHHGYPPNNCYNGLGNVQLGNGIETSNNQILCATRE